MPKIAKVLSDRAISALSCNLGENGEQIQTFHAISGVPGLGVQVTPSGARSYLLRTTFNGRRIKIGLGSVSGIGLSQARREMRRKVDQQPRRKKQMIPVSYRPKAGVVLGPFSWDYGFVFESQHPNICFLVKLFPYNA